MTTFWVDQIITTADSSMPGPVVVNVWPAESNHPATPTSATKDQQAATKAATKRIEPEYPMSKVYLSCVVCMFWPFSVIGFVFGCMYIHDHDCYSVISSIIMLVQSIVDQAFWIFASGMTAIRPRHCYYDNALCILLAWAFVAFLEIVGFFWTLDQSLSCALGHFRIVWEVVHVLMAIGAGLAMLYDKLHRYS